MKVKCDHRSKFSNLSNWKEEAWKKKSRRQRDSNPWPPRYRCDALPTELWSHTLGARSIYWVHIFPCSEMMRSLYEIIHICTAVIDESEDWSSQLNFQFKHWKEDPWKIRASTGLEPVTSAIPVRCSTNWAKSIYWVHIPSEEWNDVKYIWNNSYLNCGCRWNYLRSTPERAVRVRALAGDIVLCSWARHFTLTVPLSPQCINGYRRT